MKKFLVLGIILIFIFSLGCVYMAEPLKRGVTSFEACVQAGNPVMESYPRQCSADGKTFTEEIQAKPALTLEEAKRIAQSSDCSKDGVVLGTYMYNEITKTWWFDFISNTPNELCNPACVVSEETKTAEINWRCTGAIIPEETINMKYQSMQCQELPWQKWYEEGNIQFIKAPTESELATAYYSNVYSISISDFKKAETGNVVCQACIVCPETYHFTLKVSEQDTNKMLELGWKLPS